MPIYEYECPKCGIRFELFKKMGENGDVCCPRCKGRGVRVYSAVPTIFKGGRWVGEKTRPAEVEGDKKPGAKSKTE